MSESPQTAHHSVHGSYYFVRTGLVALAAFIAAMAGSASAHHPTDPDSTRAMRAVRAASPPRIDGRLDDAVWSRAPKFGDFTQRDPEEGVAATERTEIQFAFDDEALYVGATLYDSEPDKVVARLVRRDGWSQSDELALYIDPHHDHQTGYWFQANASGSLHDGRLSRDGDGWGSYDETWDGVWDVQVGRSDAGWTVEYRIPYSCLRFNPAEEYSWGINLRRIIARRNENSYWIMVPRAENGFVSRFGHLEGIRDIEPTRALEFLPYAIGRATLAPAGDPDDGDLFGNMGADVRYGITSGISLNGTMNPDFGQVESDPSELNLSVFETFQEERRPFFLEGAQEFDTPIELFYSRRIGRRPGYIGLPDDWEEVDAPDFTNIIGAVKVTGKTESKTTFGLLEAVSAEEEALAESSYVDVLTGEERVRRRRHLIEPRANFLVGRVKQDLWKGNSHIGGLVTALNRQNAESAYSGGVDWSLRWSDSAYEFRGQLAGSRAETEDGLEKGWATELRLSRERGWTEVRAQFEAFSDGFQINDLGFQRRNGYYDTFQNVEFRKDDPWWIFQRNDVEVEHWARWNFDGVKLRQGVGVFSWNRLRSFWEFGAFAMRGFAAKDDLDTRGGPLIATPAHSEAEVWCETDGRKAVSGFAFLNLGSDTEGSDWRNVGGGVTIRAGTRLEVRLRPRLRWRHDDAQWVENVDDDGDDEDDHFAYAQLKSRTLDLTTRANFLFNRDLSLELYLQPFISTGDYSDFKELARPGSYEFTPFREPEDDPDFRRRSLQSNLVLRWEYRPGSTLFLVWSQSRSSDYERYRFRPLGDAFGSFTDDGTHIFLVKLNYWLSG